MSSLEVGYLKSPWQASSSEVSLWPCAWWPTSVSSKDCQRAFRASGAYMFSPQCPATTSWQVWDPTRKLWCHMGKACPPPAAGQAHGLVWAGEVEEHKTSSQWSMWQQWLQLRRSSIPEACSVSRESTNWGTTSIKNNSVLVCTTKSSNQVWLSV